MTATTGRVLTLITAALILVGCAAPARAARNADPRPAADTPIPTAITIPRIGAASTLIGLGKTPDGRAATPPVTQPGQASWYEPGVRPGATGPAVILGHRSGRPDGATASVPGVFARLPELTPGDQILVDRADTSTVVFDVVAVEQYDKDTFPTAAVWADTATPALRLITCGGTFNADPAVRSYEDNIVVYAALTGLR